MFAKRGNHTCMWNYDWHILLQPMKPACKDYCLSDKIINKYEYYVVFFYLCLLISAKKQYYEYKIATKCIRNTGLSKLWT